MGKQLQTKVQQNASFIENYWVINKFQGEHFFFEYKFEDSFLFETEKIEISVIDHKTLGADGLIGETIINL